MVRDWENRSGWLVDVPKECNPELLRVFAKFKNFCSDKSFKALSGTQEELIKSLCNNYNLKPDEAGEMKLSEVLIYCRMKEKESFETWYAFNQNA